MTQPNLTNRKSTRRCSTILGIPLFLCLMFWSSGLFADVLDLPSAQPSDNTVPMPVRGQTMDDVQQQFGEPTQVLQPIGNPPITRWKYPDYTVVFEGKYVINSVLHRDLPNPNE